MSVKDASFGNNVLAYIALGVGLVALGLAILPGEVIDPPPRVPVTLRSLAKALTSTATDKPPELAAHEARVRGFRIAMVAAAIGAAALAIVAAARRQNRVVTIAAATLGAVALTWEYLVIGITVAVVLAIVVAIIAHASP